MKFSGWFSLPDDWWKLIPLGAMIGLIGIVFPLWFNDVYKQPELTYEIWDSVPLDEGTIIAPVIIRNIGHAAATGVRITIQCVGDVIKYNYESPEAMECSKDEYENHVFTLDRLIHGTDIIIYLQVGTQIKNPIEKIDITSDQRVGREHVKQIPILPDVLIPIFIAFTTLFSLVYILILYPKIKEKLMG